MQALEIGKTYQFNLATAKIARLNYEMVGWKATSPRGHKPIHWVPRWFFEKYARQIPPFDQYHAQS